MPLEHGVGSDAYGHVEVARFAARLGRFPLAMRYLTQAVDAGYADDRKYQEDADLEPLRWRPDFRRLLTELAV